MKPENVSFILLNTKTPGNIGASARAMKVMGFRELRLVSPECDPKNPEAIWMAHGSEDILAAAKTYKSLKSALRGKAVVIGTTNRHRIRHIPTHSLRECAELISSISGKNKVAILFGREDKGLLNEDLDECDYILTIPQTRSYPSLNLSQAVNLVCYELNMTRGEHAPPSPSLARRKQLDEMYEHISRTLGAMGYANRELLPEKIMQNIKKILGRTTLTPTEAQMVRGLCTSIEKKLEGRNRK